MRIMPPRHLRPVRIDEGHAIVETPEHELIELDGCSSDELEAKLHDFEAWAS
jgi:hypothetical protein